MTLTLFLSRYRYCTLMMILIAGMTLLPRDVILSLQKSDPRFYWQYLCMISDTINMDFLAGILAAMLYQRMSDRAGIPQWIMMLASVIYFVAAVGWLYKPFGELGNNHTSIMTLPCLLIFLSGLKLSKVKKINYSGWLLFTGEISYSLYLLHMAVIFSVIELLKTLYGNNYFNVFSHRFNLIWISLGITLLLSRVYYSLIEVRLSRWLKIKIFHFLNL